MAPSLLRIPNALLGDMSHSNFERSCELHHGALSEAKRGLEFAGEAPFNEALLFNKCPVEPAMRNVPLK